MDFTLKIFRSLLDGFIKNGYQIIPFSDCLSRNYTGKIIILRHDVDKRPENSELMAAIENSLGIKGTYYFRIMPFSFDKPAIRKINSLGHEIGYHYEDLNLIASRPQGNRYLEKELVIFAIGSFNKNLQKFRELTPIKTICMHGSPLSKWDSRLLWKYYDYHDFDIIGEPYFDIDFNKVLYLTDTGRRWDGESVSVRDVATGYRFVHRSSAEVGLPATDENPFKDWKVKPVNYRIENRVLFDQTLKSNEKQPVVYNQQQITSYKFHSTSDLIKAASENRLPDQIMITFHPQRWTDRPVIWIYELFWQNVKNIFKYLIVR